MYFDVPDSRRVIDDFPPGLLIPDEDGPLFAKVGQGRTSAGSRRFRRSICIKICRLAIIVLHSQKSRQRPTCCILLAVGQKYDICLALKFTIERGNLLQMIAADCFFKKEKGCTFMSNSSFHSLDTSFDKGTGRRTALFASLLWHNDRNLNFTQITSISAFEKFSHPWSFCL